MPPLYTHKHHKVAVTVVAVIAAFTTYVLPESGPLVTVFATLHWVWGPEA